MIHSAFCGQDGEGGCTCIPTTVTHPAILGGTRALDHIERLTVLLYCSEREGREDHGVQHRDWWYATKRHAAFTGQDVTELRDYVWTWATRFSDYCAA